MSQNNPIVYPDGAIVYWSDPDQDVCSGYFRTTQPICPEESQLTDMIYIKATRSEATVYFQELTFEPPIGIRRVVLSKVDESDPSYRSVDLSLYLQRDLGIEPVFINKSIELYDSHGHIVVGEVLITKREVWDENDS